MSAQSKESQPRTQQRKSGSPPVSAAGVSRTLSTPGGSKSASKSNTAETPPTSRGSLQIAGKTELLPVSGFPDFHSAKPAEWRPFLAKTKPSARAVQRHVLYLTNENQHEHVIALIKGAIIEGQAQPWMYEVLAVSMQAANYPAEEVERVVLSVADFGNASFESMMYSGAYLKNLGHHSAAVRMYRQAAMMSPERPEPYVMSMKLITTNESPDDAIWAACGVLQNAWGLDHQELHEEAENVLAEAKQRLKAAKREAELDALEARVSTARQCDMKIHVQWNGTGDLDLSVEDPAGGIASFETRESIGGGILLNDGFGPTPANCHEAFVCPLGFSGEYIVKIKKSSGKIVGNRAVVTITTHEGSEQQKKITRTVVLEDSNEYVQRVTLENGRRAERRIAEHLAAPGTARDWERAASMAGRPARRGIKPEARQAIAELRQARQQTGTDGGTAPRRPAFVPPPGGNGAIGFAPVVSVIPEGASLAALAVISPDRRYVRMALSPSFSQIVDVAVFSFRGGVTGSIGGSGGNNSPMR